MNYSSTVTSGMQEAMRRGRKESSDFAVIKDVMLSVSSAKIKALYRFLMERKVTIAFQPIWNVAQGKVFAFEALARPNAEYRFEKPQEMFDVAERLGQAHKLDAICIGAILARAGEIPNDALLFINLSPQTLVRNPFIGYTLLEAVVSAGLLPSSIVLEITEHSDVELEEIAQQANNFRMLGFRIALDDIGVRHSDVEMFNRISADFVKIDRSVVKRALTTDEGYSLLDTISSRARESGIAVIVEGIENPQMLALVQEFKGHYVQGYMLGRPNETLPDANILREHISFFGSH